MICKKTLLALSLAGATIASALADDSTFTRRTIAVDLAGAAFVVAGDLTPGPRNELVTSSFGQMMFGPNGPIIPDAGSVTLFKSAEKGNRPHGNLRHWRAITIVDESEGITFPNRPTIADVNNNGRDDVIVPGGYFFDTYIGNSRGSITWWENRARGNKWVRHDVITDSPYSFHSVLFDDFTGDGINDIVTVGEDAGNPQDVEDDDIQTFLIPGNRQKGFDAPIAISPGGGSLLSAYDVNADGRLDIVSPQFFGPVTLQPLFVESARDTSMASFVWFENLGDGNFEKHSIGIDQGPGFAMVPVPNLRGDGVLRWVATNHTNQNVPFPPFALYPEPAVYEFTPGEDPTQAWEVRTLSAPGDFPVEGGVGQAAPGFLATGDINGDGRIDIAVSGDGARGVFWLEQLADGSFVTHQFPASEGYGQSGGPVVMDLNRSGTNEVVFSSFDENAVSIWAR